MKGTDRGCSRAHSPRRQYYLECVPLLLPLLFALPVANATEPPQLSELGQQVVSVSTAWSANGARAGGQITLAIILEIARPFHVNADVTKPPLIPLSIQLVNGPDFVLSSTPIYPKPEEIDFGVEGAKERIRVFSGRTVAFVPIAVGRSAPPGKHRLEIQITYQACDDRICLLPQDVSRWVELNVLPEGVAVQNTNQELFERLAALRDRLRVPFFGLDFEIAPSKLWLLLFIAMIGGFLLNPTPCVRPLLPLKIMNLAKTSGTRRRCFFLGVAMALGVVMYWVGLAIALSTISGFNATNKLFQYPLFTVTVGIVICIMAVGMSGLFSVRLPSWVYAANPLQGSAIGSFLFGIMTAVLSTPCTAPFMGAAAAWSVTQSAGITISTFVAMGGGMAFPSLLLRAFQTLVNRVPRAGPASELVKQVMGLLMLAAGAYFLSTGLAGMLSTPPDPPTQTYWWVVAGFFWAAGIWMAWRTLNISSRTISRIVFSVLGLMLLLAGLTIGVRFTRSSPIHWLYFTPERFAQAQHRSKMLVLEFTAAWCLNCQALEQTVLHDPRVVALLNSTNVIPIKVDLTGNNSAGNQKLVEVGRRAIPYLVIYSPEGREIFASDAYSADQILAAIEKDRAPDVNNH